MNKRCTNSDIFNNKCPPRLTNISLNLDTNILPARPHKREEWNLIGSIGHSSLHYFSFSFSHKLFHAITQIVRKLLNSHHRFFLFCFLWMGWACLLQTGPQSENEGHDMDNEKWEIFVLVTAYSPFFFVGGESACLLYNSHKLLKHLLSPILGADGGRMVRKMDEGQEASGRSEWVNEQIGLFAALQGITERLPFWFLSLPILLFQSLWRQTGGAQQSWGGGEGSLPTFW